eukprot:TRINITY_DN8030_c0_g1_i3.p3 TRINITY_DN8030_c0_g1~~TRINITY_DN8030_c0_g1_i3.p3  ORF type:complete len:138 (-),score=8.15 TRINITY_DN8030_c0_g1_i3:53-466(-)
MNIFLVGRGLTGFVRIKNCGLVAELKQLFSSIIKDERPTLLQATPVKQLRQLVNQFLVVVDRIMLQLVFEGYFWIICEGFHSYLQLSLGSWDSYGWSGYFQIICEGFHTYLQVSLGSWDSYGRSSYIFCQWVFNEEE